MLNWLNRNLGDHAPMVGAITVLVSILSAGLSYDFVRNFGVSDCVNPSSQVLSK
jgi:hypothetical protein